MTSRQIIENQFPMNVRCKDSYACLIEIAFIRIRTHRTTCLVDFIQGLGGRRGETIRSLLVEPRLCAMLPQKASYARKKNHTTIIMQLVNYSSCSPQCAEFRETIVKMFAFASLAFELEGRSKLYGPQNHLSQFLQ